MYPCGTIFIQIIHMSNHNYAFFSYILHNTGRLAQKFWVDAWAKVEENELNFFRFNQDTIRADKYQVCI